MPSASKITPCRLLPAARVTLDEVDTLLHSFEKIQHRYLSRVRSDLREIRQTVLQLGRQREISAKKSKQLQEIAKSIHQLQLRPKEARSKDLKRIESLAAKSVSFIRS